MAERWELRCSACGASGGVRPLATVCSACGKPLLAHYPRRPASSTLPARWSERRALRPDMWRFEEVLPLKPGEEPVTLGEGGTPLLRLPTLSDELGLDLRLKDEGQNPTGSFKDRGLAAAVTRAARDGADALVAPSAGNAGAALAAYGARAGLPVRLYLPGDTPPAVVKRCRRYGAEIVRVDGLIDACGRQAAAHARQTGAFNLSTLREPYRIEGKKTMMLEIVEALSWNPPAAIVYPTGGGTGLIGSFKALQELRAIGLCEGTTRFYAVQSTGCAPIVRAWEQGLDRAPSWDGARTRAWGLRVPSALGDALILLALRETGGSAIAVDDAEMERAALELGEREGVSAGIEGGATLAAARRLRQCGALQEGEQVVLFNTGHFLTYG